jgi:diguanylate cyclase (GGDEF)-like protein
MENGTETLVTAPQRPAPAIGRDACLVHIYPTGPIMGTRYPLSTKPVVLGRGKDCDICLTDHSVSRRHACIEPATDGFYAIDLQSTNGTFVNDTPTERVCLHDGDYLRIGNCIYRFLDGGNLEAEYHEEIYRLTIIDGLTGVHNKRFMLEFVERELMRSARYARPLALVMIDVDFFKTVNDEMGHLCGDYSLRELAACIKPGVRREDLFARFGGEEFALVLVESTRAAAVEVAQRVRERVARHRFVYEGREYRLTVSLGVASTTGDESLTVPELMRQADEKLYQAKRDGRNCVVG